MVIIHHNFTNKFKPLDITINQKVSSLSLSHKFKTWYRDRVSNHLKRGVALLKMSDLKTLHERWIVGMYDTITSANEVFLRIANFNNIN